MIFFQQPAQNLIHRNYEINHRRHKSSFFLRTAQKTTQVKLRNITSFSMLTNKVSNYKKVLELPFKNAKTIATKQTISRKESFFQYLFIEHINNQY